jgi:hypothetical protein
VPPKRHARSSADKNQRTEIKNAPSTSGCERCVVIQMARLPPRRYSSHIWEYAQTVLLAREVVYGNPRTGCPKMTSQRGDICELACAASPASVVEVPAARRDSSMSSAGRFATTSKP